MTKGCNYLVSSFKCYLEDGFARMSCSIWMWNILEPQTGLEPAALRVEI